MPIIYDIETDYLYKKGLGQGIETVAIRCLEEGMSYQVISTITGLTETEIKEIDKKRKEKKS